MRNIILLFILFLPSITIAMYPSEFSCEYYKTVDSALQCGQDDYIKKWAYPQCVHYLELEKNKSPLVDESLSKFFPKIRLCLQNWLRRHSSEVNCSNLDEAALQSHVDCYQELGFCQLPISSKLRLQRIIPLQVFGSSLWRHTALSIMLSCVTPRDN